MTSTQTSDDQDVREGGARLRASRRGRMADPVFGGLVLASGVLVLGVLAWMVIATTTDAWPIIRQEGLQLFFGTEWDPGNSRDGTIEGTYQGGEFLFGTVVSSLLAMSITVPAAIGVALYLTQVAPRAVRKPLTYAVDLLAAVPSIVYGLWGSLFLVPLLLPLYNWMAENLGTILPFLDGPVRVRNLLSASLVLSIMVLPITAAVIREVFATVPEDERHAAYGLGATRWEVMRHVILPRCRPGIIGGSMLGLGRALGETIAVLLIIGGNARIGFNLFDTSQTVAAQIAAAFKEASPEHILGLTALGVALFVVTIIVNVVARGIVTRMGDPTAGASL